MRRLFIEYKNRKCAEHFLLFLRIACLLLIAITAGCRIGAKNQEQDRFFTSGNREADQRASQRMAQADQFAVSGSNANDKKDEPTAAHVEGRLALFVRLGGEPGISNIVAEFSPRAVNDPRINWQRQGVVRRGFFRRDESVSWEATPENRETLQKHLIQFLSLATGGPVHYEGADLKSVHAEMRITNAEFDAAIGDLKVSLDKLQIADREQKELLAIVESTRAQIVTER